MPRTEEIVAMLHRLPNLAPDPDWKERTKLKLMHMLGPETRLGVPRQWALYVSTDSNPAAVADRIRAKGSEWRPVAVSPERLEPALEAIHPVLVVIDSRLREGSQLAAEARRHTEAVVISDQELVAA